MVKERNEMICREFRAMEGTVTLRVRMLSEAHSLAEVTIRTILVAGRCIGKNKV